MADNLSWLAGLLEGEGCFFVGKRDKKSPYWRICVQLIMTDEEPVAKAAGIMGTTYSLSSRRTKGDKKIYRTVLYGKRAIALMLSIRDLMCARRQQKIQQCLDIWNSMPRQKEQEVA